ncbi:MAG: 2-C-methyl-D-erythritol 4-phosphate cytidylyltransferase [Gammaproteobacteria bacterium]|nr:2-C-methyl-D-erythritol 4-phosphate cytidylyltransferase [Gammaproteobacteria bacterium]
MTPGDRRFPCRAGVAVPAAGAGRRMGGIRKAFLELDGQPILLRAIRPFLETRGVECVVVALPPDQAAHPPAWLTGADPRVRVVAGGATRGDSVAAAVAALPPAVEVVLVHDGARPLVARGLVERCLRAAAAGRAVVAGVPAVDTLKEVDASGRVVRTPPRGRYWHAQTPQAFPRPLLERAYRRARENGVEGTDDASLVELLGGEVEMVEGSPRNLKVTRPEDLILAGCLLEAADEGA